MIADRTEYDVWYSYRPLTGINVVTGQQLFLFYMYFLRSLVCCSCLAIRNLFFG